MTKLNLLSIWKLTSSVLCSLAVLAASAYGAEKQSARDFLLSDEFFSEFYGSDSVELMKFDANNQTLKLDFKSDKNVPRASFDAPLHVDCSKFSAFELVFDIDDPSAIGYTSLYFHSKSGWYHNSSARKRNMGNKIVYVFNAKSFDKEDSPAGFDKIDAVRISFWRGAGVDSTVTFRSFKASRLSFAIVDVDDNGGENESITNSFDRLLERCGIRAERLDADTISADSLKRYASVFLPIAGSIKPAATDALCKYVDEGGFVFAYYNAPEELLKKLGVAVTGFVSCKNAGIELVSMNLDASLIQAAADRGYKLPKSLEQNSWNIYKVDAIPGWKAERSSSLFGGNEARILAKWALKDGSMTEYPALIASPNGVYCSHIFLTDAPEAKKAFLESFVVAAQPKIAKNIVRAEWISIFNIGLFPGEDVVQSYAKTLDYLKKELEKRQWSLEIAARLMNASDSDVDYAEISKFGAAVAEIKQARINEFCKSQPSRVNEGRLWWEHSGCGIYPGDWDRTMKELSEAGFNAVIPNMLWGGDAYYKSDVLPVDPKVEKYGDQIEQAVAAGKKYGVEVHAWMVCFNASNSPKWFLDKMHDEGRLQRTADGEEKPWLCPSNPANHSLELAALEEVATKYDVAGVHFDYIRFPDSTTCYCDGCKERFTQAYKEKTGKTITDFPECVLKDGEIKKAFQEWRCDQITSFVRDVHDSLKAKRPEIKLSAAVFTGYPGTKSSIGQDWGLWIDEGLLDFVCPMDYTSDPAAFANFIKQQLPYTKGKVPLYPGIGMTATGIAMKGSEVVLQAEIAQKMGAQGFTIFNLAKSTADEALPLLKMGVSSKPAKAPHSN